MNAPNWSGEIFLQFADKATAASVLGAALGITIPAAGPFPTGDESFALVAPMEAPWQTPPVMGTDGSGMPTVVTPGVPQPGVWAMLTLDQNADTFAARSAALASYRQTLASPPQVFE